MEDKQKPVINIASRQKVRPEVTQWGVMMHVEITDAPEGMMLAVATPSYLHTEEAVLEFVVTAMKAWEEQAPYPTPDHEAFAYTVNQGYMAVARRSIAAVMGGILPPEAVQALVNNSQNDLTRRPN